MVQVDVDGFAAELDSQYSYRYPPDLRAKYPEEAWNAMTRFFTKSLNSPGYETIVAELPSLEDPTRLEIVAVAVWGWADKIG
jgi:hypothetical protein